MALCPQGHASGTDDYCDVCGAQMSAPATPAQPVAQPAPQTGARPGPQPAPQTGP